MTIETAPHSNDVEDKESPYQREVEDISAEAQVIVDKIGEAHIKTSDIAGKTKYADSVAAQERVDLGADQMDLLAIVDDINGAVKEKKEISDEGLVQMREKISALKTKYSIVM